MVYTVLMVGSGHDPSAIFHRKVNRRAIPSYYEVIKEPMAMSTIKQKIITKGYKDFSGFVRDFALVGMADAQCGPWVPNKGARRFAEKASRSLTMHKCTTGPTL